MRHMCEGQWEYLLDKSFEVVVYVHVHVLYSMYVSDSPPCLQNHCFGLLIACPRWLVPRLRSFLSALAPFGASCLLNGHPDARMYSTVQYMYAMSLSQSRTAGCGHKLLSIPGGQIPEAGNNQTVANGATGLPVLLSFLVVQLIPMNSSYTYAFFFFFQY